jgi:signal transduction histidine kinase/CheY-like chemotaxis protein
MQLGLKNRLRLISLLPILIIFSIASYHVYQSYIDYIEAGLLKEKLIKNRYLKEFSKSISDERGISVIYLNNDSSSIADALTQQRKIVDKKYKDALAFSQNLKSITESMDNITKTRVLIDSHQASFKNIFEDVYAKAISSVAAQIEETAKDQSDANINELTPVYISMAKAEEFTAYEREYISYVIANSIELESEKLNLWLSIIAKTDVVNYETIHNESLSKELGQILRNQSIIDCLKDINTNRATLLSSAYIGEYSLTPIFWNTLLSQKIDALSMAQEKILKAMDKRANDIQKKAFEFFVLSVISWFISIVLATLGYLLSNEITFNIKNLESVLKRVAEDSDENYVFGSDINLHTAQGTAEAYKLLETIISQTREDKVAAQEASEAKSMFLANMSHEIRTPLNGIVGFTELLRDTGLKEEQLEFVDIIEKSSENLLEIINNILDLSKIESNKLEIEDILFNPIEEFESAIEVYAVRASEKHIDLGCFIDPSLENPIKGDPTKIKEVIINLLSNAVKFTSASGAINVNIRKLDSKDGIVKIKFEVQDSGIGVTNEQKSRIFEAFTQADTSITRKYGGTGLGLTISSKFVELMGGQLDLYSEVGKGTTFFFTLDFEEVRISEENIRITFSDTRVLILKDAHKSKKQEIYLCEYLDFYGVSYTIFKDMDELMRLQKELNYDLVFVDYAYCSENMLSVYAALPQKLILLTKSSFMKKIDFLNLNIFKTIYEPLNSTKIKNVLFNYKRQGNVEQKTEQKVELKIELETENKIKQPIENKKVSPQVTVHKVVEPIAPAQLNIDTTKFSADVLVAEDNIINQKLIKRTLEDIGLNVTIANNGLEAFQKRKDGNFDLIFMDIQMPYLDGVEATNEILEYEEDYNQRHIPIIALTANALKGDREKFLAIGLDEYTTKPLVRKEIVALLNHFLSDNIVAKEPPVEAVDIDKDEPKIVEEIVVEQLPKIQFETIDYSGIPIVQEENEKNFDDIQIITEESFKEDLILKEEPLEKVIEKKKLEETIIKKEPVKKILQEIVINEEPIAEKVTQEQIEEPVIEKPKYKADILMVKKSSFESKLYIQILKSLGYSYEVASSEDELEELIKDSVYKIILLDKTFEGIELSDLSKRVREFSKSLSLVTRLILVSNPSIEENPEDVSYIDEIFNTTVNKESLKVVFEKYIGDN